MYKNSSECILVTGGAGFIGANFILQWIHTSNIKVINLDILSYAGNSNNLESLKDDPRHIFVKGDIADRDLVLRLLEEHKPYAIINFAAESHVDRSIADASNFIHTNILGTYNLLETTRVYWNSLPEEAKKVFRFLHISTDEVYGSLEQNESAFTENSLYQPNSPYSASKASSDHLVRAWHHTYGLPVITTNCSNNYGPFQFPEKLIPLVIDHAVSGQLLPIYGDGKNIRDWLFVQDHCEAIRTVLHKGKIGETYNIGGNNEKTNLEVVQNICLLLDKLLPLHSRKILHPQTKAALTSYHELIAFVPDRLGHDRRYAINSNKIQQELGWQPKESFETGIAKTVEWYVNNSSWVNSIKTGEYLQCNMKAE
ncbi:dTDP-glucose 4,6-dehydratase [Rickettsia endosymbiont of Halotydeus destructor]|uniref:dTDP-glucose 4,6-dehydratase n=1 Tax=Rickettsia endosymbiont of Halotydeus destructor TaxID=2996754 RepID=UPI003BB0585E